MSKANAAARDAALGFEGRWSGQAIIECTGVTAPLEIIVEDGDMSGELIVRGQGQGDGKYFISGYIDRKGRLSDGRMMGPFRFSMRGKLSGREGKGEFYGPECSGNWKLARAGTAPLVKQEKIATSAPTNDAPPVIVAPGDLQTERSAVELVGRVSDASKIIEFTVNGTAAPLADDGSFQLQRGVAMGQSELVIADSCYSGTLVRAAPIQIETWEDRRDWLKRIVEKRSRTSYPAYGALRRFAFCLAALDRERGPKFQRLHNNSLTSSAS